MTIAIIIILVVLAVITWIVIAVNCTQPLSNCCLKCLHEHKHGYLPIDGLNTFCCDHYGLGTLRRELELKQKTIDNLQRQIEFNLKVQEKKIYMPSIKEQELMDKVSRATKTSRQLIKDLEINL